MIHTLRPDTTPANRVLSSGQPCSRDELEVLLAAHEVEPDAGDRQPRQHRIGLADVVEVGVDEDLGRALDLAEPLVGALERLELGGRAVLDQHRLVDLDPLGAQPAELREHLRVDLDERVEQLEPVELLAGALALQQEGERADQDRLGLDPELLRLLVLRRTACARTSRNFMPRSSSGTM